MKKIKNNKVLKSNIKTMEKTLYTYDKEFYYHTLLLPEKYRESLFLLRSFSLDLACIFAKSHSAQAGMIRLQWWQDVIQESASPWRGHHSDNSLQDMILGEIHAGNLHKDQLLHMIQARRWEFDVDNFSTNDEFHTYVEDISSPYFYHVFQYLNIPTTDITMKIIKLAGRSWGITAIMRGMVFFKEQNRCVFSREHLRFVNIKSPSLIHNNKYSQENKMLMKNLIGEVESHLEAINMLVSTYVSADEDDNKKEKKLLKNSLKKGLIPLMFLQDYLKEIKALDYNVYAIDHRRKHLVTLVKILLAGWP